MQNPEIYPNAPVVLTAFEVRHSTSQRISPSTERKIKEIFGEKLPIRGELQSVLLPGSPVQLAPRFKSRDRTIAVTFQSNSLTVETTSYKGWDSFRSTISLALQALHEIDEIEGVSRIGLRYIDEIRVPEEIDSETINWANWVSASLLGPAETGIQIGLTPTNIQGLAGFKNGDEKQINVRFGNFEGGAVDPAGDLKRSTAPIGPYFLFDIDSFWEPLGDIKRLGNKELLSITEELHSPIHGLFDSLITEPLRNEVLRNG